MPISKIGMFSMREKLLNLTPEQFENLIFDLCIGLGMTNTTWRTPGRDGGRDIQGTLISRDFSMHTRIENWYVECKRYDSSINWPTIYEKISYASNHNIDYLLLATTSTPSPQCRDEIEKWNSSHSNKCKIRIWDYAWISLTLTDFPQILYKYGIVNGVNIIEAIKPIMDLQMKIASSLSASLIVLDKTGEHESNLALTLSAIIELLANRMEKIKTGKAFSFFDVKENDLEDIDASLSTSKSELDCTSLRALLLLIKLHNKILPTSISLSKVEFGECIPFDTENLIKPIIQLSNFTYSNSGSHFLLEKSYA